MLSDLQQEIKSLADPERAKNSSWFFKTKEGQYGYGDLFLGLSVPQQRKLAKKFRALPLENVEELLHSKYHEERLIALFILVEQFSNADDKTKEVICHTYLQNTKSIFVI